MKTRLSALKSAFKVVHAAAARRRAVWKLLEPWTRIALIMYPSWTCVIRIWTPAPRVGNEMAALLYLKPFP